jgi:hypothetical protein
VRFFEPQTPMPDQRHGTKQHQKHENPGNPGDKRAISWNPGTKPGDRRNVSEKPGDRNPGTDGTFPDILP